MRHPVDARQKGGLAYGNSQGNNNLSHSLLSLVNHKYIWPLSSLSALRHFSPSRPPTSRTWYVHAPISFIPDFCGKTFWRDCTCLKRWVLTNICDVVCLKVLHQWKPMSPSAQILFERAQLINGYPVIVWSLSDRDSFRLWREVIAVIDALGPGSLFNSTICFVSFCQNTGKW